MRSFIFLMLIIWAIFQLGRVMAEEKPYRETEMPQLLKDEFRKTRIELKTIYTQAKRKIAELDSLKSKVISQLQKQAETELAWIDHLKKYDILLSARYTNEKGEYHSGLELSQNDIDNINKLLELYIKTTPLSGRVTVGQARKTIETAQDQLKEYARMHHDPTEKNNSDLEIIIKQKEEAETQIKKVTDLAEKLAFEPNAAEHYHLPAAAAPPSALAPAPPRTPAAVTPVSSGAKSPSKR